MSASPTAFPTARDKAELEEGAFSPPASAPTGFVTCVTTDAEAAKC